MPCIRPRGVSSGRNNGTKWVWGRTQWVKCKCGLWHSNRLIPREFWDQPWDIPSGNRTKAGIILIRDFRECWVTQCYNKCYGFPKGESGIKENTENTARREFLEETGMNLGNIDLSRCKTVRVYIENVEYVYYIIHVPKEFECNTFPRDDVEITSFGWVKWSMLKSLNLSRVVKIILQKKIFIS